MRHHQSTPNPIAIGQFYIGKLLFDRSDPRLVGPALDRAEQIIDSDARLNLLLIVCGALDSLPSEARSRIVARLRSLRPRLDADSQWHIDQVIGAPRRTPFPDRSLSPAC